MKLNKLMAFGAAMVFTVVASRGAVFVIAEETFSGSGWAAGNKINDLGNTGAWSYNGAIGNPAGSMEILNGAPGPVAIDRFYADSASSGGAFTGDYTVYNGNPKNQFISFDFYNYSASSPSGLQIWFNGTANNSAIWVYDLGAPFAMGLNSFSVTLSPSQGSWLDIGSGGVWATDVADIARIGVRVVYVGNEANSYYVDNFRRGYNVPEPGTYAALGFAFASMGLTFRRRLNELATKVKGMFKA